MDRAAWFRRSTSAFSACRALWNSFKGKGGKSDSGTGQAAASSSGDGGAGDISPSARTAEREQNVVMENDLEHLLHLLEKKDGETEWQSIMERCTPNLTYQA